MVSSYTISSQAESITGNQDGLGVGVIYLPNPKKFSGLLGLMAPAPQEEENASSQLETSQIFFHPGTQFVQLEQWHQIISFDRNKTLIDRFQRQRILTVVHPAVPEGEEPTGTSRDFIEEDAILLIENAVKAEWVRACIAAENSRPDIKRACIRRLDLLVAEENKRSGVR